MSHPGGHDSANLDRWSRWILEMSVPADHSEDDFVVVRLCIDRVDRHLDDILAIVDVDDVDTVDEPIRRVPGIAEFATGHAREDEMSVGDVFVRVVLPSSR